MESVRLLASLCKERHEGNIALVRSLKGTAYEVRCVVCLFCILGIDRSRMNGSPQRVKRERRTRPVRRQTGENLPPEQLRSGWSGGKYMYGSYAIARWLARYPSDEFVCVLY